MAAIPRFHGVAPPEAALRAGRDPLHRQRADLAKSRSIASMLRFCHTPDISASSRVLGRGAAARVPAAAAPRSSGGRPAARLPTR